MGEKRKPCLTILLKIHGKKNHKVELFDAELFGNRRDAKACVYRYSPWELKTRYRLRVNGKWWHGYPNREDEVIFFTKTQIKEILFRGLKP